MKQSSSKLILSSDLKDSLIKKHYGVFNHSAVQICSWNKKSLRGEGECYKFKAYGVDTYRCMQFSPVVMWCQQNCTFCWRPMEYMRDVDLKFDEVDEPKDIIDNLIPLRKKLLSGFGGNDDANRVQVEESWSPTHYAISLSGEPTLYPKLNEMIVYLKSLPKTKTIFVVSNGQEPHYFNKLIDENESQPTQLYISIDAPNEELFCKINHSVYDDGWDRLNESISYLSKIDCRTVFRMTQIKGLNDLDEHIDGYEDLVRKGNPDFIEVKAYMFLGLSRKRHTKEQMPNWEDVLDFSKKLCEKFGNYEIGCEVENSLIVILRRKNSRYDLLISPYENEK